MSQAREMGYDPPTAEQQAILAAQAEGQVQPYGSDEYDGQVGNFGEGKGGKGEPFQQTEKLWLFGEKKPLSIQSYGSLPVEVRFTPACAARLGAELAQRAALGAMGLVPGEPHPKAACAPRAAELGGCVARRPARDQ